MRFLGLKSSVYIDKYELLWYTIYTTKYLTNRKKDVTGASAKLRAFYSQGSEVSILLIAAA